MPDQDDHRRTAGKTHVIATTAGVVLVLLMTGGSSVPTWLVVTIGLALVLIVVLAYQTSDIVRSRGQVIRSLEADAVASRTLAVQERNVLDGLADGLDVWILLIDQDGTIKYANKSASKALGFANPVGESVLAVTFSRELADLVTTARHAEPSNLVEINLTHPRERIVLARVWQVTEREDQYFMSIYDVTDLRRLERARRDFVANVSHELRTPMATIRAMAETLLDEPEQLSEHGHRYLDKIVAEVDRLTRISNDLLTLSVAETGTQAMEPIHLEKVVSATMSQMLPKAERKGLKLVTDSNQQAVVMGNAEELTQVMLNILDNAINYTIKGSVTVNLNTQGGVAELTIEDTGIGIPSEHTDRIFERFYRVDKARSRATGGTGLGLSIVRNIVESHGGTVNVSSVLNQGSAFRIRIPLLPDEP